MLIIYIIYNLFLRQHFDIKDVLSGAYLLSEIDKETVTQLLELLAPEKLRYEPGRDVASDWRKAMPIYRPTVV